MRSARQEHPPQAPAPAGVLKSCTRFMTPQQFRMGWAALSYARLPEVLGLSREDTQNYARGRMPDWKPAWRLGAELHRCGVRFVRNGPFTGGVYLIGPLAGLPGVGLTAAQARMARACLDLEPVAFCADIVPLEALRAYENELWSSSTASAVLRELFEAHGVTFIDHGPMAGGVWPDPARVGAA